jgi:hypothetical protein
MYMEMSHQSPLYTYHKLTKMYFLKNRGQEGKTGPVGGVPVEGVKT